MPLIQRKVQRDPETKKVLRCAIDKKVLTYRESALGSVWRFDILGNPLAYQCPVYNSQCRPISILLYNKGGVVPCANNVIACYNKWAFFPLDCNTLNYKLTSPPYKSLGGLDFLNEPQAQAMDINGNIYLIHKYIENFVWYYDIYSYDNNLNYRWKFSTSFRCSDDEDIKLQVKGSTLYVLCDIYIGGGAAKLYKIDCDTGNEISNVELEINGMGVFAVDDTETYIYAEIYPIEKIAKIRISDGATIWEYNYSKVDWGDTLYVTNIVYDDGDIYFGIMPSLSCIDETEYDAGGGNISLWEIEADYEIGNLVNYEDPPCPIYRCILAHTASEDNIPGQGPNWQTYWEVIPYKNIWKLNSSGVKQWATRPSDSTFVSGLDYDNSNHIFAITNSKSLRCLSKTNGSELWSKKYTGSGLAPYALVVHRPSGEDTITRIYISAEKVTF